MYTKWTAHLETEEEKENFRNSILRSKRVLERLNDLLKEEEENLNQFDRSSKAFEKPNWAYLQAFRNGERALLEYMKKLVTLDKEKDNGRQSIGRTAASA